MNATATSEHDYSLSREATVIRSKTGYGLDVSDYFETIPALRDIYLEDSYVLAIHESEGELRIDLDAVLTENHPQWTPPKPGEPYCFRRIRLIFERPRRVEWIRKDMRPSRDATGEIEYG
ncbi:MAG TPA: hypothetical protein VKS25_10805, partial [Solirubrobacteraceae bacterium]|nr:hypothetical protein [Solirubrobacteraceae bacterium]